MPPWCHHDAMMPPWCHHDATMMPPWCHHDASMIQLWCHYEATVMPLWSYCGALMMPLWCHYDALMMPLWWHCYANIKPQQCNYHTNMIALCGLVERWKFNWNGNRKLEFSKNMVWLFFIVLQRLNVVFSTSNSSNSRAQGYSDRELRFRLLWEQVLFLSLYITMKIINDTRIPNLVLLKEKYEYWNPYR